MLKVSPNYFPNESSTVTIINKSRNKADTRNHIIDDREKKYQDQNCSVFELRIPSSGHCSLIIEIYVTGALDWSL